MHMKDVGLYDVEHFGALSLHLRCGLVSPSSWHHVVCRLPYMQDSVLEWWLAFLQTGLSPVEPSELILAHSCEFLPNSKSQIQNLSLSPSTESILSGVEGLRINSCEG